MSSYLPDFASSIDSMSYEDARSRLVEIISRLEQGSIPLEESLALWEVGEKLASHCENWLEGAQKRLDDTRSSLETGSEMRASQPKDTSSQEGISS